MSASPDTSPFDQNVSELSDNEPSTSTTSTLPRIKLKIRLNPTPHSDYDQVPDDGSSRKHKRKKKRSHKKHKHGKYFDDNSKGHGEQHRRHSEVVDIDDYDDEEGIDNNNDINLPLVDPAHSPQADEYPEYQHIPVGGKRPFAMLQQQQRQGDVTFSGDGEGSNNLHQQSAHNEEEEEEEEEHDYTDEEQPYDDGNDNNDDDGEYDEDYDEGGIDEQTIFHPTDITHAATKKSKVSRSTKSTNKTSSKSKKKTSNKHMESKVAAKKRGRPTKRARVRSSLASTTVPQQHHRYQHGTTKDYKKELKNSCMKLWDTLSKRDDYGFFLEPVNTKLVRDYLTVIKRPMDFSTLRRKIENDSYSTMDDFRKDFLLIVQNAKLYNAPDTIYWKSADKLESYGIKAIDRAEKLVQETLMAANTTQQSSSTSLTTRVGNRQYAWQQHYHKQPYSRKDSATVKEEEVDILGLDGPARKASRVDSERTTREPSLDTPLSRATTPMHQHAKKKKKKKMTDAGVIYGPDGSIHAIGGVNDLYSLLPTKQNFSDPPRLTTINPQALPSAFYQPNRSIHDDWTNHKHFIQPSVFCDYGPFPFTTLGSSTPAMFYRPQDAHYVFPLYGDDTGEAYLKSVWQFMGDLGLDEKATSVSRHVTRGAYDIMAAVIDNMDLATEKKMDDGDDDIDIDNDDSDGSLVISTEFGTVDVGALLKGLQQQQQQDTLDSEAEPQAKTTELGDTSSLSVAQENTPQLDHSNSSGLSPSFSANSSHPAPHT
ncbi:hypothetical protein BC941DRAFT_472515 [Chlamydoabsidia padenii]|nr:hypothetical protein BC941DRAFT_472515 [Chlamydoabsidia padenii]